MGTIKKKRVGVSMLLFTATLEPTPLCFLPGGRAKVNVGNTKVICLVQLLYIYLRLVFNYYVDKDYFFSTIKTWENDQKKNQKETKIL